MEEQTGLPRHPGKQLMDDYLAPLGITPEKLAHETYLMPSKIEGILDGSEVISADIAMRLSIFLGVSAEFWLKIQNKWDLYLLRTHHQNDFALIQHYRALEP